MAKEDFFFVETDKGAFDVISILKLDSKFGPDWYTRAEKGEVLKHRRHR